MLSSRERVERMFDRRDQDRVPRHDTFWPDTITRWQSEGLNGDASTVAKLLRSDMHGICWIAPTIYPDEQIIAQDEQTKTIRDGHGKVVRYWKNRSGTPEHIGFECSSRAVWERRFKPHLLRNTPRIDLDKIKLNRAQAAERWVYYAGVEPFELSRAVMGDENTLVAMCEDPDWIADFAKTYTDVCLKHLQIIHDAGIEADGLWIYGDMAYNHGTLCSPSHYKELIWPQHRRLAQWAHSHDMRFIFHTDGDVRRIIPLYIDAGFDCLQPLEAKANMDVRELAPQFGHRLALFGNINAMTMGTNDLEAIEQEIAGKFAVAKQSRGYVYHSDHSVPPTVSWETYQHIIALLEKHGRY